MGFDFRFRLVENRGDLSKLTDFLRMQSLGYPNYEEWVEKARKEIEGGYKTAVIALSDDRLVGDLVFQQHKQIPFIREIKNLRVHPELKNRGFARFMLRQAEVERGNYEAIVVDARADQRALITLLIREGYTHLTYANLYDDSRDVVMIKSFDRTNETALIRRSTNFFSGKT